MELEQIRRISLVGFLEGMGHVPVSRKGNDVWFRSPFRNERTASFKVDTQRNVCLILDSEREVTSSILPGN